MRRAPGCHFKTAIFNLVLLIGIFTSSNDNALRWMSWGLTDDKSALVQVMAWCRHAASHYLRQCWPSFMSPYGVTRPQWVKSFWASLHCYCWSMFACFCFLNDLIVNKENKMIFVQQRPLRFSWTLREHLVYIKQRWYLKITFQLHSVFYSEVSDLEMLFVCVHLLTKNTGTVWGFLAGPRAIMFHLWYATMAPA